MMCALDGLRFGYARGYWDTEELQDACLRTYRQERFEPYRERFNDYLAEWIIEVEGVVTGESPWRLGNDFFAPALRTLLSATVGEVTKRTGSINWPAKLLPTSVPMSTILITLNFRPEAELQKLARQPGERGGPLGRAYKAAEGIMSIEIFADRIATCVERIGATVYAADLAKIAFIQQFNYALQLNESNSVTPSTTASVWDDLTFSQVAAGLATWHTLQHDQHRQGLFAKACTDLGPNACTWEPFKNISMEELRVLLWFHTHPATQNGAEEFKNRFYTQHPTFPRLPSAESQL